MEQIKQQIRKNINILNSIEQTPEICRYAIKKNGFALQLINKQTEQLCILAVQRDCDAFQYVKEEFQTPYICKLAVGQNYNNLKYVKNISNELALYAVKCCGYSIQYINNPTLEICNYAVCKNPPSIYWINNIASLETCKLALIGSYKTYDYINRPELEYFKCLLYENWFCCDDIIKIKLVLVNSKNILYLPETYKSEDIYNLALSLDIKNAKFIPPTIKFTYQKDYILNSTEENLKVYHLHQKLLKEIEETQLLYFKYCKNYHKFQYNRFQFDSVHKYLIDTDMENYKYISIMNDEVATYIINKNPSLTPFLIIKCRPQTKEFSLLLVSHSLNALQYIKEEYLEEALKIVYKIDNDNYFKYIFDSLFSYLNKYYDIYPEYLNKIYEKICIKHYCNLILCHEKFIEMGLKIISEIKYDNYLKFLDRDYIKLLDKYYNLYPECINKIYENALFNIDGSNKKYICLEVLLLYQYNFYGTSFILFLNIYYEKKTDMIKKIYDKILITNINLIPYFHEDYKKDILQHILNNIGKIKDLISVIKYLETQNGEIIDEIYKCIICMDVSLIPLLTITNLEKYFEKITEKQIENCPICGDDKKYYLQYKCHENHLICLQCMVKNSVCYYKCGTKLKDGVLYVKI